MIAKMFVGWMLILWGAFSFLCGGYELACVYASTSTSGIGFMIIAQLGVIITAMGINLLVHE